MKASIEELSQGICSKSNLSRIENNEQIPSRATYEAFMQRLGQPHDLYPSIMGENEARLYKARYEILNNITDKDDDKVESLLKIFENEKRLETVYQQFVLYVKAVLHQNKTGKADESLILYLKALERSVKDFSHKKIFNYLLNKDEINIINCIANCNFKNGNLKEAIAITYALKKYHEVKYDKMKNYVGTYAMVLFNLTILLRENKSYNEIIEICDIGIKTCIQYNELKMFPGLLYNKGRSLYDINKVEEAKRCIREAYSVAKVSNDKELCDIIPKYVDFIGIHLL